MKVTIGICAFNVEKYIEQCVRSAIDQLYKDLEIIVIDDGSKDSTGQILDRLAKEDSRIIVVHKENEGHAAGREQIIKMMSGDAVYWLDSDDYLTAGAVFENVRAMQETNADIVKTPIKETDVQYAGTYSREEYLKILLPDTKIKSNVIGCLIKKEVYKGVSHRIGFTNEDYYIFPFLANNAKKIVVLQSRNYKYRTVRPGSITFNGRSSFKGFYPRASHRADRYALFKNEFPEECEIVLKQFADYACMCCVYAKPEDSEKLQHIQNLMTALYGPVMRSKNISSYKKWLYRQCFKKGFLFKFASLNHKIKGNIRTLTDRKKGLG